MGKGRDKKKKAAKAKSGGEVKGAKNKEKSGVKIGKSADERFEDELEDIDVLLQEFQKQQLEAFKITEEINCAFPSRRVNASFTSSTVKLEEIILFGGEFFDGKRVSMYNDHFIYNTEKNEWKKIISPNSPGPRASHQCVASNNGCLFLFGGEFVSPNETNFFLYKDFWMLDLKTNEWQKLEIRNRPSPRSGHRMTKWKHYLVLYGGFFDQVHDTKYLDDLWLFDTQEFKWIEVPIREEPKPSARSGFQFLTHNDNVILYGGYSKAIMKGKTIAGVMHTDTWILKMNLDPSLIKWERKKKSGGNGPGVRSGCTTVYHKGLGFMFGGVSDIIEDEETIESIIHSDFFQFNLDSNKFYPINLKAKKGDQSESLQPGARFNPMISIAKNTLYLFGGILEKNEKEFTLNDFWAINADKMNEWICLAKDETLENEWKGEKSDDEEDSEDEELKSGDDEEHSDPSEDKQDKLIFNYHEKQEFDPLPELELEPKPGEKMGEYFDRTSVFWLERALKVGDFGGKVLRRVAFMQSERHYLDRLSGNELLMQQFKENEVAIEEAVNAKKESETRQRNR